MVASGEWWWCWVYIVCLSGSLALFPNWLGMGFGAGNWDGVWSFWSSLVYDYEVSVWSVSASSTKNVWALGWCGLLTATNVHTVAVGAGNLSGTSVLGCPGWGNGRSGSVVEKRMPVVSSYVWIDVMVIGFKGILNVDGVGLDMMKMVSWLDEGSWRGCGGGIVEDSEAVLEKGKMLSRGFDQDRRYRERENGCRF